MTEFRKIDDNFYVAPQITVDDVARAAAMGFRTLMANRPDHEEPGQVPMADIEAAAKAHGLAWVFLPVQSGNITDADVDRFAPELQQAEKPLLAFCRSGTRCSVLWALASARTQPADVVLIRTLNAGYDLGALRPRLAYQAQLTQE